MVHRDPEATTPSHRSAAAMMLGAGALFSTGGAAIKLCSFSALEVAGLRAMVAVPILLLLLPQARRGWHPRVWLVACSYAATLCLFVVANKLTTAANTIFLQATAPFWVLLLGPVLLGEKVRGRDLVVLACIAGGMSLFFVGTEEASATAPDPALGNLAAAGAGLGFGLTLMGFRWLARAGGRGGEAAAATAGNLITAVVCLSLAWPLQTGGAVDWVTVVYLGVFQIGLAYFLLTRAVAGLSALEASLLLMIEPALSPFWAWWLHGEVPSALGVVGGCVIIGAVLVRSWVMARGR